MKRALFVTFAVVAMLATSAAFGLTPHTIVFSENWEMDMPGTLLKDTIQWTGDNATYVVAAGNYAQLTGDPNSGNNWVCTQTNFGAGMNGQALQLFHMELAGLGPGSGNRTDIYVLDEGGAVWLRWYGDSTRVMPRHPGGTGPEVPLGSAWSDMDIVYNSVTGLATWYADGAFVYSIDAGAGKYMQRVELNNQWGATNDAILMDNIMVGPVPEPSSLLALSVFGVGIIGYIKRRRA